MEWFERWFGEEYLLVYQHRDIEEAERDVRTIIDTLKLRPGELVLDLCCGSGRHDVFLAGHGLRVVGLDYSRELLAVAGNSKDTGSRFPVYVRADARDTVFREAVFDAVLNLFTSFGYFTDDENEGLLHSISRLLKPAGRFYIDYLNPPCVLENLVETSTKTMNGMHVEEHRRYDPESRRIVKDILLDRKGDVTEFHESVRLYELDEMNAMIANAGLIVDGVYGSAGCSGYDESSERMIIYGHRQ